MRGVLIAGVWLAALCGAFVVAAVARAAPSTVDRVAEGVLAVRDDAGAWGGGSLGMTHQRGPDYQAKKLLDLSAVPEADWQAAGVVRLSAYFCVRDYSWHDAPEKNGLDEAFEIVVNGHVHRVPTNSGVPVYGEEKAMEQSMRWHDFALPKEWLVRGPNELVFRLVPPQGKAPDDYLYLGIDNTVAGGNSWVRFGGEEWHQDRLNAPGGKGEYMVRLYLIRGPLGFESAWRAQEGRLDDPAAVVAYAGSEGDDARVEWDPQSLDALAPLVAVVEIADSRPFALTWLDERGEPVQPPVELRGPRGEAALPVPRPFVPGGLKLEKSLPVVSVTLRGSRSYHPIPRRVDMAPHMAPSQGAPAERPAACRIENGVAVLVNPALVCRFAVTDGRLRLQSLYNQIVAAEMARRPDDCALFLVEIAGKRYAGSRDFIVKALEPIASQQGFAATLVCEPVKLEAVLTVRIDDCLRIGLSLTNRAEAPVEFKTAFPHLAGLAASDDPADDYYFFPWGGGIISDEPAVIRRGYGDHEAIYQLMDLFSPQRGGGLAVWCTDDDGRHKVLALRKHVPGRQELNGGAARTPTAPEYCWTQPLDAVQGVGLCYEYLRRTRLSGESFAAKDAALQAHAGDWRVPMRAYADWCHRVWRFRPYPSRLGPVVNMLAAGWGQGFLFRDGKYRTDIIQPRCDCVELMSWWEWSPLGPWRTPWEDLDKKLGPAGYRSWTGYFVKDPVTGQTMFNNGPGDYDGYNERFGGLPAFRDAISTYRKMGALVTLYTDPLRLDDNTRCGQQNGQRWCIVQPDGKFRTAYDCWNPCLEVAEYRRWVADAMGRVMRETDADGIRLDEYGHCGAACFSKTHEHTFAEPGTTEWQRCVAESSKLVRQAMDQAKPGSVLTTEHPGYDYLMQFLEGCITYDLTVQATPLRPMECNLQRFFFPECKCYELDHRGADPKHRKRFWNAVASFGAYYPADMYAVLRENDDAFSSRDCEPLVPTLVKFLYANRFGGGEKTVYTLYNATGHSYAGPLVEVDLRPGEHVFDLLRSRDAECTAKDGRSQIRGFLARDDVGCIACLPVRLSVKRSGDALEVVVADAKSSWEVRLCDAAGQPVLSATAAAEPTRWNMAELPPGSPPPVCVKLLEGPRLLDAAAIPAP